MDIEKARLNLPWYTCDEIDDAKRILEELRAANKALRDTANEALDELEIAQDRIRQLEQQLEQQAADLRPLSRDNNETAHGESHE